MKKHLFSKMALCLLSLSMLFLSCNQNNSNNGDAELGKPTELKVHDKDVNLTDWTVEVKNDKTSVKKGDVKATFKIGEKSETLEPEVEGSPVALQAGVAVNVVLKVPAQKGKWKEWKQTIKVTQATSQGGGGGGGGLPNLEIESLKVNDTSVTPLTDLTNLQVQVPDATQKITKIEGKFKLNGTPVDNVTLTIDPTLPQDIAENETKTFNLSVAKQDGKHNAWTATLKVTRPQENKDPELTLDTSKFNITGKKDAITFADGAISATVIETKEKLEVGDITAEFKLNGIKVEGIVLKTEPELPITLSKGIQKLITLKVDAKPGHYQEWTSLLSVTRDGDAGTPTLTLQSIKVHGVQATKDKQGNNAYSVKISQEKVEKANIVASFLVNRPGSPYPEPINDVALEEIANLPATFTLDESKTFNLSVAKVDKKHEAWHGTLKITRITKKPAEGVSIKVADINNTMTDVTDGCTVTVPTDDAWLVVEIDKANNVVMTKAMVQDIDGTPSILGKGKSLELGIKPANNIKVILEFAEHETIERTFNVVKQ